MRRRAYRGTESVAVLRHLRAKLLVVWGRDGVPNPPNGEKRQAGQARVKRRPETGDASSSNAGRVLRFASAAAGSASGRRPTGFRNGSAVTSTPFSFAAA